MAQDWPDIASTDQVADSRSELLQRDESNKSNFSGTSFPSTDLLAGMCCYRTDTSKLYKLKSVGPSVWVLIADLTKTYLAKEDADVLYKAADALQTAAQTSFANSGTGLVSTDTQAAIVEVKGIAAAKLGSWADVSALIPSTSNAYGNLVVQNGGTPSGGANGDRWEIF